MPFEIIASRKVVEHLDELGRRDPGKFKRVTRCLAKLEHDPTHPGLSSHPYINLRGPLGETIWESYVENRSPSAWRVWWYYGPGKGEITLFDLGPHP